MMRAAPAVASALVFLHLRVATAAADPCAVPTSLKEALSQEFKGYRIVTLQMLSRGHRAMYRTDHPRGCPGVAKLDYYGTGTMVQAILLSTKDNAEKAYGLILAEPAGSNQWKLTPLDFTGRGPVPVIWTEGSGSFKSTYDDKKLVAKFPVIFFVGYESWAVVYSWTGASTAKIWVSD